MKWCDGAIERITTINRGELNSIENSAVYIVQDFDNNKMNKNQIEIEDGIDFSYLLCRTSN